MQPDEMEQKLSEIEGTIQKMRSALEKQFREAHQSQPMPTPEQIQRVQLGIKLETLRGAAKAAKAAVDELTSTGVGHAAFVLNHPHITEEDLLAQGERRNKGEE